MFEITIAENIDNNQKSVRIKNAGKVLFTSHTNKGLKEVVELCRLLNVNIDSAETTSDVYFNVLVETYKVNHTVNIRCYDDSQTHIVSNLSRQVKVQTGVDEDGITIGHVDIGLGITNLYVPMERSKAHAKVVQESVTTNKDLTLLPFDCIEFIMNLKPVASII
ncbi:hypothetical protein ACQUY5_16655 [Bacillus cereus]|uniref:hypothetical protein n=1 Tax=Bacillus cereus TaxID=1396 RepID=UPI003D18476E